MKKEVLLAIGVGFGLGLLITFGIWTANKSLKRASVVLPSPTPASIVVTTTPSPTPVVNASPLTISSPEDESLVSTDTINVTGKAAPKSVISVTFEDQQNVVEADANGNFSVGVDLIGGYNTIVVTATDPVTGVESSQTLVITYSTVKL